MSEPTSATAEQLQKEIEELLPPSATQSVATVLVPTRLLVLEKKARERDEAQERILRKHEEIVTLLLEKVRRNEFVTEFPVVPRLDPAWMNIQLRALQEINSFIIAQLRWGNGRKGHGAVDASEAHRERNVRDAARRRREAADAVKNGHRQTFEMVPSDRPEEEKNGETTGTA